MILSQTAKQSFAISHATGRRWERLGREVITAFAARKGVTPIFTDPALPAAHDAILLRRDVVSGVVEVKVRGRHAYADLKTEGTYLITADKLTGLLQTGRALAAASYVVAQLADQSRWWWCIGTPDGERRITWEERPIRTQLTSVDVAETKVEVCAFLPFASAYRWD